MMIILFLLLLLFLSEIPLYEPYRVSWFSMKDGNSADNRNLIPRTAMKALVNTQSNALCYSHRPKGCAPLLSGGSKSNPNKLEALPLPCVSEGKCPFETFRCDKGHEWRSEPGVPMCFACPICENNAKIQAVVNQEKMSPYRYHLIEYVEMEKDGFINNPKDLLFKQGWKSKVEVTCAKSHVWKTSVYNLLKLKTWCPVCVHSLQESDYQETASWFGGKFLGFSRKNATSTSDSSTISSGTSKPLWRCSLGHVFSQSLKNIRLNPGGTRACSWCPTCRRNYNIEFLWNVELSRNCQDNVNFDGTKEESKKDLQKPKKGKISSLKKEQRRAKLLSYVNERNGSINNIDDLLFHNGWNSKIRLTCQNDHTWDASLKSLLYNHRWCPRCASSLTIKDFEETAKRFNGTYLGLVKDDQITLSNEGRCLSKMKALWKCEKDHQFLQRLSNIRNRKHCSWCQRCREESHIRFTWD